MILHTLCQAICCTRLGNTQFFVTASNGSSHIASNHLMHHTQGHVQPHFKHSNRNIPCPQGILVTVIRTMPPPSSRCLAAMWATCKESGHAKKHTGTCKHRLHKVSFYDRTAKTLSLFDLCASSNSKRAGTVSSSAIFYKACLISSHGGSKSKHDTSLSHACLSTLDQQCVQPKQERKLAHVNLHARMLNGIADFPESRLIPGRDLAVFRHRHTKINWIIKQLRT